MTQPLHIAIYYPAKLPIKGYGGTERVVVWLVRGLALLGHRVTLLSLPGSSVPEARCISVNPQDAFIEGGPDLTNLLPSGVDLFHSHVPLSQPPKLPYLWTFHGTGKPGRVFPASTVGLSADHAARHRLGRWVHNGLDPTEYLFGPPKGKFDLFLGRLHSVKGWQWAIKGARRSGRRIKLAGGWRPSIRPSVRFLGSVAGKRKATLLAQAECLWMPAQWDEPFGLTTIEAMVSGTPVLGTYRGALPEVITPTSGAMANSLEELVEIRPQLDELDPEQIRANVLQRFTHLQMAANYERLYRTEIGLG